MVSSPLTAGHRRHLVGRTPAGAISETLSEVQGIFGGLPPGASDWIRSFLGGQIDLLVVDRGVAPDDIRRKMNVPTDGAWEPVQRVSRKLMRDLNIELGSIELRAKLGSIARGRLPSAAPGARTIDAFISHATEDKLTAAQPIAQGLVARGFTVWLDEYELKVGDSIFGKVDEGLRSCRFGVVVLSASFFSKRWPQNELHAC